MARFLVHRIGNGHRENARQIALLSLLAAAAVPTAATDLVFSGYARDISSGDLQYVEAHAVRAFGTDEETRVVMYRCSADGPPFARKQLTYSASREDPEFAFEDARFGYLEGMRRVAGGREVYQRDSTGAETRTRAVPNGAVLVSDAGFDEFVRLHWADIEAGKTVKFPFLVPSRLKTMTFKVKKHHEVPVEGATAVVIRLNLSGFLGFFLPYIEVSYRKADRVLLRYKGLTNIRDAAGDNTTAEINFPDDERRVEPVDLEKLRAEKLVARCP